MNINVQIKKSFFDNHIRVLIFNEDEINDNITFHINADTNNFVGSTNFSNQIIHYNCVGNTKEGKFIIEVEEDIYTFYLGELLTD